MLGDDSNRQQEWRMCVEVHCVLPRPQDWNQNTMMLFAGLRSSSSCWYH